MSKHSEPLESILYVDIWTKLWGTAPYAASRSVQKIYDDHLIDDLWSDFIAPKYNIFIDIELSIRTTLRGHFEI